MAYDSNNIFQGSKLKDISLKDNRSTPLNQKILCDASKMDLVNENNVTRSQEDTPVAADLLNASDDKGHTAQSTSNGTGTKLDFSETDPGLRGSSASRLLDPANKSGIHLNKDTKIYISGENLLEHSPPGIKDKSGLRTMQRSRKNKTSQFDPKDLIADKSYEKKRSQSKDYRISNGSICISQEAKHSGLTSGNNSKLHNPHENTKSIIDKTLTFSRRGQDLNALASLESSEDPNNPSKTSLNIKKSAGIKLPGQNLGSKEPSIDLGLIRIASPMTRGNPSGPTAQLNANTSGKNLHNTTPTGRDTPSNPHNPYDVELQDLVTNKVFRKYDRRLQKNFDVDPLDQIKIHRAFTTFRHRIHPTPTPYPHPLRLPSPSALTHAEIIRIVTTKKPVP